MNQPTAITVSNYMGKRVNPHEQYIDGGYFNTNWRDWNTKENLAEHPCPSIANTERGETVMAYLQWQEQLPLSKKWVNVSDGTDPKYKKRQIWVPIVKQKEGEGKFGEWVTEEIAIKMGFSKMPHFTVMNSHVMDIGRNRLLSLGCIGTPNEVLFIEAIEGDKVTDLVCLHNFDHDGRLTIKRLQQIIDLFNHPIKSNI